MNRLNRNKVAKRPPVKHKKLFKKTHDPVVLKKLAIALAITLLAAFAYVKVYPHTFEAKQVHKLQTTVQQLKDAKKQEDQLKTQSKQQDEEKAKKIEELNKQLQDAQSQLQARAAAKAQATAVAAEAPAGYTVNGCGDNEYANYIYMHESGCRTNAFGSLTELGRACGIGQALPCSKLPCALDDYNCQNAWFTNYAIQRYGSWYNAYVYWLNHHNW